MIEQIIDLHIHSKYSRACSPDLELPKIALACEKKGIDICATGDFTHPAWFNHIKELLVEDNSGLFKLKDASSKVRFILSTEISCIYKHKDATRRLHLVVLAPSVEAVGRFIEALEAKGANVRSDGRPILGLSGKAILQMLLDIDERFMLIPAHAWTPWFSIFGSKSGYNKLDDCFEELSSHIHALETGLSSDPIMNHMWSALDNYTLVSNSDAHSLDKLGREANVLEFADKNEITFSEICRIIKEGDKRKFKYTIEFFPEEGKYHFDGHADCKVSLDPEQTKKENYLCPKCKKKITVGVLSRVVELSDRKEKEIPKNKFIPHKYIVPLKEIIASVFHVGDKSKKVNVEYENLIKAFDNEFNILLRAPVEELKKSATDENIALAISNMRQGKIRVVPGYDGIFGTVDLLLNNAKKAISQSRLWLE
ncbi:MAG: endonuclease Q family protein [Candidatus Magasanikbacteria bacterium]|nr:endonuclease Q family protein [Candidatus Magasanikbacteria bacterium]